LNDDGTACTGSDQTAGTCLYKVRTVAEKDAKDQRLIVSGGDLSIDE